MNNSISELMKQAKLMQDNMQNLQKEVASKKVKGVAGAGAVEVIMNGHYQTLRVKLDESLKSEDLNTIADLFAAANNDATRKIELLLRQKLQGVASSIELPEEFKESGSGEE